MLGLCGLSPIMLTWLRFTQCSITSVNYIRLLRVSPAMEAGLTDTLKDFEWIVSLVDAAAPKPGRPKTYKKKK